MRQTAVLAASLLVTGSLGAACSAGDDDGGGAAAPGGLATGGLGTGELADPLARFRPSRS